MQIDSENPEVKLLCLLIQSKSNVDSVFSSINDPDLLFTENSHKTILKACIWARDKDKTISIEQFEYFCKFTISLTPQKIAVLVAEYSAIERIDNIKSEDISVLVDSCKNMYYYY